MTELSAETTRGAAVHAGQPPAPTPETAPFSAPAPGDRSTTTPSLPRGAVLTDDLVVAAVASASGIAAAIRAGAAPLASVIIILAIHAIWVGALSSSRALAVPLLRLGSAEYRHVIQATIVVFGITAIVEAYVHTPLLQSVMQASFPVALGGVLLCRLLWGRRVRAHDSRQFRTPTLVVGSYYASRATAAALLRETRTGAEVVGICLPESESELHEVVPLDDGTKVPVIGSDQTLLAAIDRTGARAVALTPTDTLGPGDLRKLIWELDEKQVELVLAPGVVDVAGHRVLYQAVSGMPMLSIARPQHRRADSLAKRAFDIVFALAALLFTLPLTVAVAIAIKIDSRGPLFYRAERVGARGRTFRMVKFRSMVDGADRYRDTLADKDVGAGVLFKIPDDPRVTRVGRLLRRYSVDELPQFINVLTGEMSVVGPRPALPAEVAQYPPVMRRRHLVKPGITGAWQVSGRSDLSWDESVRLDLGYVENWSIFTDLSIVARTVRTVVRSSGAY
ncbi:sugar transferase [Tsukamurella strandjordii]|uniref:sugar transferase n=1 Tax=Tsukamurella TaxID=2060 RepID=UPI001C7E0B7E|nr:sugar transferase [Tsukamurella sp. TY48]GIZ97135.1 polyprenyl glycosylphosphotransferase [Tsukamurella sp. TY48]